MNKNIVDIKRLLIKNLIMVIYIFAVLIVGEGNWCINYIIALITSILLIFFIKNKEKLKKKEKDILGKIFYFLVIIGIICIIIM